MANRRVPIERVAKIDGTTVRNVYFRVHAGVLPAPTGPWGATGWPAHEILAIQRAREAGLTKEQIRALVFRLEAERLGVSLAAQEAA